jgi:hypothetical protein
MRETELVRRWVAIGLLAAVALAAGAATTSSLGQTGGGQDCANRPSTTELRVLSGERGRKLRLGAPWALLEGCDQASDTLDVKVDWGDGTQSAGKAVHTPGNDTQVTLKASHVYAKARADAYPIVITITNTRTGVSNADRHYVAQISEPLDVKARSAARAGTIVTVGGRGRELISVTLSSVRHVRRGSKAPTGTLTLTTGGKLRTYTLKPLSRAGNKVTLLHRGKLGVVLRRHGSKLIDIGALPKRTTQIVLQLARGVLKRTHSCSSAALLRVDAARRHRAPASVTAPVSC